MSAAVASSPGAVENTITQDQVREEARWAPFLVLPCRLTVDLPLPNFRVADFLALRVGLIIGTNWGLERDLPVRVNETLIGRGELEGNSGRLAVRLTELI